MLGWVLVALTFGECYVADDIYNSTDRKTKAGEICKKVLGHDNVQNFAAYNTKVKDESALTNQTVLFIGNGSYTVDLDVVVSLSYYTKDKVTYRRSVTVYFDLEDGKTGTVTLARNKSSYDSLTNVYAVNVEILDGVSVLYVKNSYPGLENRLYVTTFTDHSKCSITSTKTPIIYAERIIMSANLIQRHTEESVQLIGVYYMFVVDEDAITGSVSGLITSYSSTTTVAQNSIGNGWTLVETETTAYRYVIFIVKVDTTVTMGRYSCELKTVSGTFLLNMGDQFGEVMFDLQKNVTIDFYCEDVETTELLGGRLSHNAFLLNGTSAGPVPSGHSGFLFHGTWPYVADLLGKTAVIQRKTSRDSTKRVITKTTYWGRRQPMFRYFSTYPLMLIGQNTPVYFSGTAKPILLGAADVGIQIDMDLNCTITMCKDQNCVLRVKGQLPNSFPNITGDSSHLEVIARTCTASGSTSFRLSCEKIDLRQVAAVVENLTLIDGGTIYVSYTYPNTFPSLSPVWETYAGSQTWFAAGDGSSVLWSDWTDALALINKNLDAFSEAFKKDIVNRFPSRLRHLDVRKNATLLVTRQDVIPFASFYPKAPQEIVCLEQNAVLEDWSLSMSSSPSAIQNGLLIFGKYGPAFSDFELPGSSLVQMEDKKCIGIRAERPPGSAASVVVYTSNETYSTLLSAFPEYVTVVTPSNISGTVPLTHPSSKNIVVLCLDSVPDGQSIQLGAVRSDANVFVFGIPLAALDTVFKIVALAYDPKSNETTTYYSSVKALIEPLVSNYTGYFPKVSITPPHVGCILLAGTNYMGKTIDSEHFYALGCRFQSGLSVTSTYPNADTYSYETLKDVVLNDVVLFPIATETPDHISITEIAFGKDQVTMSGNSGYYQFLGPQSQTFKLTVDTRNIRGQLHVLSFSDRLTLSLSDATVTKVKGVKVIMNGGFKLGTFDVANFLPASPLLSTDMDSDTEAFNILEAFAGIPDLFEDTETTTNTRTLVNVNFTGNWEQVKEIEGYFGMNAGGTILNVNGVPTNVLSKLNLETAFTTSVNLLRASNEIHLGTQVISGLREMSLGINPPVSVTFENLTFARGLPGQTQESSFTLLANYQEIDGLVAKHVKCSDYSRAVLGKLSIIESLEMGVVSSLTTTQLQADNIDLKLHYNFAVGFPPVPQNISAKAIKLVYDGDDSATDVESYRTKPLTINKFEDQKMCTSWESKVSYESTNPDYSGSRSRVKASCANGTLILTLGDVKPTGKPKNVGAIVGGVFGALAVAAIVGVVVFIVLKRRGTFEFSDSSASPDTEIL